MYELTICCAKLIGIGKVPGCIVIVCMLAGKPVDADDVTLANDPRVAGFITWMILSLIPPSIEKNLPTDAPLVGEVMELLPSS